MTSMRIVLMSALAWSVVGCSAGLEQEPPINSDQTLEQVALAQQAEADLKAKKVKLWKLDDPCDPNPCTRDHQTVCAVSEGDVVCLCDPAYTFNDAGVCVSVDDTFATTPCESNPCEEIWGWLYRTMCTVEDGFAVCSCAPGYVPSATSHDCEDPCVTTKCGAKQVCSVTWAGPVCEKLK
jgi:hypothetical protein